MTRWFLVVMVVILAGGASCGKKKADEGKAGETSQPGEATAPAADTPTATGTEQAADTAQPPSAESGGQSFADGMKALCNPEIDKTAPPSEKQMKIAAWIKEHVSNPEVVQLFQSLGELPPAEREAAMDRAIGSRRR